MKKICAAGFLLAMTMLACNNASDTTPPANSSTTDTGLVDHITSETKTAVVIPESAEARLVHDIIESVYGDMALLQQGYNKTTTPSIKALAKKVETESTALLEELKALHTKKGWPLPTGLSVADQEMLGTLGGLDIPTYEKEWRTALRNRFESNIKKLQTAKMEDAEVKAVVGKTTMKLKELIAVIK